MTIKATGTCSRILTPKQVGPICWFMAAFVAMFYSQRSRRKILNVSHTWNKNKKLFTLFKQLLNDKYLKVASRESEDYEKFSDNTFGEVLSLLNKEDSKAFPYNPKTVSGGFNPEFYIGKLYKLLGVDYKLFDYNVYDNHLFYHFTNEELNSTEYKIEKRKVNIYLYDNKIFKYEDKYMAAPPILMVLVRDDKETTDFNKTQFPHTLIPEGDTKTNLTSLKEKIYYHGIEYNLDSVILANWNKKKIGHAIAGISCKKKKYIYNGWTRTSMDPIMANKAITRNIPCELMPYDWNIKKHGDFCLNPTKCIPDILKTKKEAKKVDLCFNFSKGKRVLVYVRKDPTIETSIDKDDDYDNVVRGIAKTKSYHSSPKKASKKPKQCPDGKVLNPATGRCILSKNAAKAGIATKTVKDVKDVIKKPKQCPDGKVLNPATGRCILSKNAAKAGIATKTVKDVKDVKDVIKKPKQCPDGKVLNPATGRCILIKNAAKAGIATKTVKDVIKTSPKKPSVPSVEMSIFSYVSKTYVNEIIFVKLGKKVYIEIEITDNDSLTSEDRMMDILMPFDELMKNKYLKKYYELSLMAIGKPNIDPKYTDPEYYKNDDHQKYYHIIDTIFIVENDDKTMVAKKGNSYRHFNLDKLRKKRVADAVSIAEFNTNYYDRFGIDDTTFANVLANYTALVNKIEY
jgi:ribosomal protein L13E